MKNFILAAVLLSSSAVQAGAMSAIDLETREAISFHLEIDDMDAIHSLQFAPNQDGCYFTIQAKIDDLSCYVCFKGEGRNFYSTKVSCQ